MSYYTDIHLNYSLIYIPPERLRTILICASVSTVLLCCKAVYGGRLWRPVLILEVARLVQQYLGTSAAFLSYVFVAVYMFTNAQEVATCEDVGICYRVSEYQSL
jgi:hypothetical protein